VVVTQQEHELEIVRMVAVVGTSGGLESPGSDAIGFLSCPRPTVNLGGVDRFPPIRTRRSRWRGLSSAEGESLIRIYEDSFPPAERNPLSRFRNGDLEFWLGLDDHDEVVAFCAVGHLPGCAYLQYLAVSRELRDRGIGAGMLESLAADLQASDRRGVVLEIEDPARTEDPLTAERRKAFYARWGAEPLAGLAGYYIPDRVEPDTAVPMLLLWRPSSLGASQPAGDELRSLVRQLYAFEYAEFAPADYLPRVLAGVVP
jgi:GNAT superfamily N-acetyltransferase